MIDHLDNLLRHLFIAQIDEINDESQVRFQPPDADWRTYVSGLERNTLNVYLMDLRENRKLRSNERIREVANDTVTEAPAPRRMDCHYLITAWSPATVTPTIEPTVEEHALLYKTIAVLVNNEPLIPQKIYESNLPQNFPKEIADAELPTTILPVEGFSKAAEFWGTVDWRWKPAVYLIVTLPVILEKQIAGSMVTTRITEYRQSGKPETAEVWIQIGGTVTDPKGTPVANAWVRLETLSNEPLQTTTTKEDERERGCFTFVQLKPGIYRLRVRALGFPEFVGDITVPSPAGNYDVKLT
jgi:hypothetical protein